MLGVSLGFRLSTLLFRGVCTASGNPAWSLFNRFPCWVVRTLENPAADGGLGGFEAPSCSQCPVDARYNKLHLLFFSFSFPVRPHPNFFLLHIVKETKAIHLRNLQRETQPSRNTSRRAEKQPQTSQLMTSGAFQKKRAFLWFGYSWSWVVPHLE